MKPKKNGNKWRVPYCHSGISDHVNFDTEEEAQCFVDTFKAYQQKNSYPWVTNLKKRSDSKHPELPVGFSYDELYKYLDNGVEVKYIYLATTVNRIKVKVRYRPMRETKDEALQRLVDKAYLKWNDAQAEQ